jgi:hypothetical protein
MAKQQADAVTQNEGAPRAIPEPLILPALPCPGMPGGAAPWRFLSCPFARPGPGPAHQLNAKIRQMFPYSNNISRH